MYTLITGGAGYIGSHIAKILNNHKNLIIVDNLSTGKLSNCKYGTFINSDITNIDDIEKVFKDYIIENVIHVAGRAFVGDSIQRIDEYYNINVVGTINILNMMLKYNVKNIIFSSSCSVYGNVDTLPITEETVLNPISPYGETKKICEDIITTYGKTKNLNYVLLRYFNVAGNDFDLDVIDNENNFKRLIPTVILKGIKDEKIQINGNDYKTKDGTCVRNYIHVVDLARAHIDALNYLEGNGKNLICNLGSDENYSVFEIVKLIGTHMNKKLNYEFKSRIKGDPVIVYCDNKLAKDRLGWITKYCIHDIIKSYIQFIIRFHNNIK